MNVLCLMPEKQGSNGNSKTWINTPKTATREKRKKEPPTVLSFVTAGNAMYSIKTLTQVRLSVLLGLALEYLEIFFDGVQAEKAVQVIFSFYSR